MMHVALPMKYLWRTSGNLTDSLRVLLVEALCKDIELMGNSNSIASQSVQLLELVGALPDILMLGVDGNGKIVLANELANSVLLGHKTKHQSVDQLIRLHQDWKETTDTAYHSSQEVTLNVHSQSDSAQLYIFRLPMDEDNSIVYAFIIDLGNKETADNKSLDMSMEHQTSIQAMNRIIGLANGLMKQEGSLQTQQLAKYIYDKAWSKKEAGQGSVLSKIKDLPPGYDLIDFNEIFAEVVNMERLGIDPNKMLIDTEAEPVIFFSHPQHLQTLFTELIKHFYQFAKKHPVTLSLKVKESQSGVIIRIEGQPLNSSGENLNVLASLHALNGSVELIEKIRMWL
jgi:undecaprenyl pyrophosphate synthase